MYLPVTEVQFGTRQVVYLRTLLIQGARSTLQSALRTEPSKANRLERWIIDLYARKGYYKTMVAIANKHARMLWAMLAKDENYDPTAWQRHPMNPARLIRITSP